MERKIKKTLNNILYPVVTVASAMYLAFFSLAANAQEEGLDADVDINVGEEGGGAWYTTWWIWAVVLMVFIIIIVAITNRGKKD